MKTSSENLTNRINAMPAEELRKFAANVVRALYLVHDEENPEPVLDSDKEWEVDTIEQVAARVAEARLDPSSIASTAPLEAETARPLPENPAGRSRVGVRS